MFFFCLSLAWHFPSVRIVTIDIQPSLPDSNPCSFIWECRSATIFNLIDFDIFNNHWLYSAFQLVFFPPPSSILCVSLCRLSLVWVLVLNTTQRGGIQVESLTFPLKAVTWPHGHMEEIKYNKARLLGKNGSFFTGNPNEGNDSNFTPNRLIPSATFTSIASIVYFCTGNVA